MFSGNGDVLSYAKARRNKERYIGEHRTGKRVCHPSCDQRDISPSLRSIRWNTSWRRWIRSMKMARWIWEVIWTMVMRRKSSMWSVILGTHQNGKRIDTVISFLINISRTEHSMVENFLSNERSDSDEPFVFNWCGYARSNRLVLHARKIFQKGSLIKELYSIHYIDRWNIENWMSTNINILVFGAHPDNAEVGMAGTIAKHVLAGMNVGIYHPMEQ